MLFVNACNCAAFESLLKIPYPMTKVDIVGIPDFQTGAMENWGLITFREVDLLVPPGQEVSGGASEEASIQQLYRVPTVVAHELAHMWFGTPRTSLIIWAVHAV
jgi:aminopeptidase N